jgi:hypothetical protein
MALRGHDILRLKRKPRFLHALRITLPCCTAAIDTQLLDAAAKADILVSTLDHVDTATLATGRLAKRQS